MAKQQKSAFRRAKEKVDRFNDRLGELTTNAVGTMWCAYIFLIWSLLPLEFPKSTNIVQYVSQGIIQLVLLSVILVGQAVQLRHEYKRAERDHKILEHLEVWRKHHEAEQEKARKRLL